MKLPDLDRFSLIHQSIFDTLHMLAMMKNLFLNGISFSPDPPILMETAGISRFGMVSNR